MTGRWPRMLACLALAGCAASPRAELLATIRVPTLLVWGDAGERSPIAVAHAMRDAIPGARPETIPGAGHLSNLERPAQLDTIVRDFVSSASKR